jgi:hypothetical protein
MSEERWLPVVGFEGFYEVSDQGRVRSLDRQVMRHGGKASGYPLRIRGRVLAPRRQEPGYSTVQLHLDGRPTKGFVHRLVMQAFVGPCPEGMEVRHINGDAEDSRLANLAYGTHSENLRDKLRHGTDHQKRKTHCPSGHPYDEENTYVIPTRPNARYCRACARARGRVGTPRLRARQG